MVRLCAIIVVTFLCALKEFGNCQILQQNNELSTPEEICKTLTNNSRLRDAIAEAKKGSAACPCTKSIIERDATYKVEGDCYTRHFFESGVKQKCCYDNYGNLIVDGHNAGYVIVEEFAQDIENARHACCVDSHSCDDFNRLDPPDDCTRYRPPYSVKSWGDPQITTVDNHTFTFNGHGEYLFLLHSSSDGSLEIQARTGFAVEGNFDATLFTAFVISVQRGRDMNSISVFLNKSTGMTSFLNNGTAIPVREAPTVAQPFMIFHTTNDSMTILPTIVPNEIKISNTIGLGLAIDLTITPPTPLNGTGLAGNIKDGHFVGRNGTIFNISSSEHDFFNYSESWSLGEDESNFHYNLTGGNFIFYNTNHTVPRFLEELTGNLTALFEGWDDDNITKFKDTCFMEWRNETSTACLLAIARSKSIEAGRATLTELRNQYNKDRALNNKPPTFTSDMITHLNVNYSDTEPFTLDLSQYVTDPNNDTLTFEVVTNIENASTYSLDNITGLFTWKVDAQGRVEEIKLSFVVKDDFIQTLSPVSISYCGCETEEDCNFEYTDPTNDTDTGNFERFGCICKGVYSSGRFCESRINPCDMTNCSYADFDIECDEMSEDENPCDPCPNGYDGKFESRHQICEDINECLKDNWCDHTCTNSEGGFTCKCYKGFELDTRNNRTCIDVDECAERSKICNNNNEMCSDPRGNATCICIPGYSKKDEAGCEKIEGFRYTFTMSLMLNVEVTQEDVDKEEFKEQAKQGLFKSLNSTLSLLDLVIDRIYLENTQNTTRVRRAAATPNKRLHIDYSILTQNQTTYATLRKNMTKVYQTTSNITIGNISVTLPPDFNVTIPENGSCGGGYDCDSLTAHCEDNDGNVTCECNDGYQHTAKPSKYCIDTDECSMLDIQDRCIGGTCINLNGGWNCTCPVNTTWAKVGDNVYPYHYRCQGNFSYIGNIRFYRAILEELTEENITEYFQSLFDVWLNNETREINNTQNPPLKDLYLTSRLFNIDVSKDIIHGNLHGYFYNFSFISTLGSPINISRLATVFDKGNELALRPDEMCTNNFEDCKIFNMSFYKDTDDMLCNLGNDCDTLSTTCTVSNGKYQCNCKQGFDRFDEYSCRDVDECTDGSFTCSNGGTCVNLEYGNWTCICPKGFVANYIDYYTINCTDVDECADNTTYICKNGECNNKAGGWNCSCAAGFQSEIITENYHTCTDIDECGLSFSDSCKSPGGDCVNTIGNWTCSCAEGYTTKFHNDTLITCEDVDECLTASNYTCNGHGNCTNTIGSWSCNCTKGYRQVMQDDNTWGCSDVDECKENMCNGTCNNTDGSFTCECGPGYNSSTLGNESVVCYDIDECSIGNHTCGNGTCNNQPGNWTCQCDTGYELSMNSTFKMCKDINECNSHTCIDGKCKNTVGSWNCACAAGYSARNVTENVIVCEDIKECILGSKYFCLNLGTCRELQGNWTCDCPSGFKTVFLNETHIDCQDIDECNETQEYSCINGICDNSDGSWSCKCNTGFVVKENTSKTVKCEDINECSFNDCDGDCVNTPGSWSCVCPDGFVNKTESSSNVKCEDVDECAPTSGYHCENSLRCINTNGSWTCICRDGERIQTVNRTKTCNGGHTYVFNPEVYITTKDEEKQKNESVLKTVLRRKIQTIFLRIFPDRDFTVGVDMLRDVRGIQFTYDVSFWLRIYSSESRQEIVDAWNKSLDQECKSICKETDGDTFFNIEFNKETTTKASNGDVCNINGANPCDEATSRCTQSNGEVVCVCRTGFNESADSKTSCIDVNECTVSGQCTHGNCSNTGGSFVCSCPVDLNTTVKNSKNITVCSGSNKYSYAKKLNISRQLNETEKAAIVGKLEQQIAQKYAEELKGTMLTVVVTITESANNTRRRRRATNNKSPFIYQMVTTIYCNASDKENTLKANLNNITVAKIIKDITKIEPNMSADEPWQEHQDTATTASTTLESTTPSPSTHAPCTLNCANGGNCSLVGGVSSCSCPATYTGQNCDVKLEPKPDSEVADLKTILFATAGGLGGLILVLIVVIIIVCRRYSQKQQRKSKVDEHIHLGAMGVGVNNEVYISQDYKSTNVDRSSLGSSYSHSYRPGQLPRTSIHEPKPDYDPPPVYIKPNKHKTGTPKPDYRRSGSPTPDYRDGRLPKTSDSSHDSGMDISRGSLNMERRYREQANNPMRMAANRRSQPMFTHSNHL